MTFDGKCGHCGGYHIGTCPRVKAVEYHPNGTVKRVEYHEPHPVHVQTPWVVGDDLQKPKTT